MWKPYSDCTRLYGPNPRHAFPDELSAHKKRGRQKICRPRIRNGSAFGRVCAARSEPTNGRKHAEANMSYSISTNWLSTATVSPSVPSSPAAASKEERSAAFLAVASARALSLSNP